MLGTTVVLALIAALLALRVEPESTRYGAAYRGLCHAYEEATADRLNAARQSYTELVRPAVGPLAREVQPFDSRIAARLRDAASVVEESLRTGGDASRDLAAMEVVAREAIGEIGARPSRCVGVANEE